MIEHSSSGRSTEGSGEHREKISCGAEARANLNDIAAGVKARISENLPETEFCRRLLVPFFFLLALPMVAQPQASSPAQDTDGDGYTINVNVGMVVLNATALDHKNVLVSGLSRDDFQIYEDGVLQPIKQFSHQDLPVTVGLVIDNSGSMMPKRSDVIAAALAFARSSNPQDEMFVVTFNEKVSFGLPANIPFTDNLPQLERALSRIAPTGQTALYDAVAAALEHLKQGTRDKKVLIVVSDGGDNKSTHTLNQIVALAGQSEAIIYSIGIFDADDPDQKPQVLKRFAKDTGGEAFMPESLKEILPICERIARDIRNQYTLAYIPTNRKRDGTYRAIQIKASATGHGRLSVRSRTGYVASPTPASPGPASSAAKPVGQ